jgi:hypothetical protein
MQFLHVTNSEKDIGLVNKYIQDGKHVFLFIHLETCSHCIHAFPLWKQLKNRLAHKKRPDVLIADINAKVLSNKTKIKNVGEIIGYPTIKYIHGKKTEEFNQERTADLFMNWIETNIGNAVSVENKTRKGQRGGVPKNINKIYIEEPNTGYEEPNTGYEEPNTVYKEPNMGYEEPNMKKMTYKDYLTRHYSTYPYFKNPQSNNALFRVKDVNSTNDNHVIITGYYIPQNISIKINNENLDTLNAEIEVFKEEVKSFSKGGKPSGSNRKRTIRKRSKN